MQVIARNINRLKDMCGCRAYGCFCSQSYEDIFQDTILVVAADARAVGMQDEELIGYFAYRFRMVEYQIIHDNKMLKEIPYADYIQTKETDDAGEG